MNLRSERSTGGTHQFIQFMLFGGLVALINWRARIALSDCMLFVGSVVLAHCIGMAASFLSYVAQFLICAFLATMPVGRYPEPIREGLAHRFAIVFGAISIFVGHKPITFRII